MHVTPGPLIALDKSFSRLVSCTSKTHSEGGAVRAFGPRFIERLLTYFRPSLPHFSMSC